MNEMKDLMGNRMITIIGMGSGNEGTLTVEARRALCEAEVVIGTKRLLESARRICGRDGNGKIIKGEREENSARVGTDTKQGVGAESGNGAEVKRINKEIIYIEAWQAEDVIRACEPYSNRPVCILFSGDTGLYSGATALTAMLQESGIEYSICPGLSSVQLMAAAIGESWERWRIISAHGREIHPVAIYQEGGDIFFLTGGKWTVREICRAILKSKAGGNFFLQEVCVGSNLGMKEETVFRGSLKEAAEIDFPPLSVLLIREKRKKHLEKAVFMKARKESIFLPDSAFVRGRVPMTKQEVRAAVLMALAPRPDEVVWDIGAGTGSVSIEMARHMTSGCVYAIERKDEAIELIRKNASVFLGLTEGDTGNAGDGTCDSDIGDAGSSCRLVVVQGDAPKVCDGLPTPDAVFIGGSRGALTEILDAVRQKNPQARIVLTAILTETLALAEAWFDGNGLSYTVTQIAVSRTKLLSGRHMMQSENPVWIISGVMEE